MITIDEDRMRDTATKMADLRKRNQELRQNLETLFDNISDALQCETGNEIKFIGKEDLLKPLEDMDKVLEHMSDTLQILIGEGNHSEYPANTYYDRIFAEYNELIISIKQMVQKTEE